jgi:glycine betaine/proline transport system ATP-binding protein
MAKIEIRAVSKLYGGDETAGLALLRDGVDHGAILARTGCRVALREVSLEIPDGALFVLMGLSGSGKSTLLRHLNRLIEPSAGDVLFDDKTIIDLTKRELIAFRRQKVSMVFQGFGLLPHRSVVQNVMLGLLARGDSEQSARSEAMGWIERVGLSGHRDSRPAQLSGGMQQRVGLARALAMGTEVILMDEAFSALDPLSRADMQDLLQDLQARLRKTVVFVTHDLNEAVRLGGQIAVMRDGVIVQQGQPADILSHPADDYVARFVQAFQR